jgi:type II secretory pathway pseudopilin PulG
VQSNFSMRAILETNPSRKRGLTLMEIVISIGLVAVITLFVMGVLSRILITGGKTAHQTAANLLAEEVVELAASAGPPDWSFSGSDRTSWEGQRDLLLPGEKATTPFRYRLEELTLRNSIDDLGSFHQLTLTVWWTGDEPESKSELGKTHVEVFRKVYVRR